MNSLSHSFLLSSDTHSLSLSPSPLEPSTVSFFGKNTTELLTSALTVVYSPSRKRDSCENGATLKKLFFCREKKNEKEWKRKNIFFAKRRNELTMKVFFRKKKFFLWKCVLTSFNFLRDLFMAQFLRKRKVVAKELRQQKKWKKELVIGKLIHHTCKIKGGADIFIENLWKLEGFLCIFSPTASFCLFTHKSISQHVILWIWECETYINHLT
jgi:hypothetical protein